MLTYAEALETILNNIGCLDVEDMALIKAKGQVLAEDIYSDYNLPLKDTSRLDGYAVKARDIEKAQRNGPVALQIIETVRAGYLSRKTVSPGMAVRIMTGSVVPDGADCVVRFEDTDEPENKCGPNPNKPTRVKIFVSQAPGDNINKKGGNIREGALLMPKSAIIGTAQLATLTAIGKKSIRVVRRPQVAIATTGDELVKAGKPLTPGKTYDSNGAAIRSLVEHYGGIPRVMGIVRDDEKYLFAKIQEGLSADAIITTGGVSKGDYDLVRQVIGKMGKLVFFRINMGPGAAFAFGLVKKSSNNSRYDKVPIFALSGPPQGCMVNFETLVRPALLKMRGIRDTIHPSVEAVSEEPVSNPRPMDFVRWTILKRNGTGYTVTQDGANGLLNQLSTANSLTIIPGGAEIKAGDRIPVLPLDWCR